MLCCVVLCCVVLCCVVLCCVVSNYKFRAHYKCFRQRNCLYFLICIAPCIASEKVPSSMLRQHSKLTLKRPINWINTVVPENVLTLLKKMAFS